MNGSANGSARANDTTPARRRRRAGRHATPPQRQAAAPTPRQRNGTMRQEPKPLQRYAHKHKQALWPLTITACLIGGAGVFELLRVFASTPWCRPICYILVGFTLALKAFSVHVANEGGPIALLPTPLKRWLLTTSVLDAASEVAMLVDFQHWIGVFIHAIQMLRLDSHEREEILHKLGPTIRRWATRPGLLRAIRPLHDALVWEESDDDDDEVPVARPVSETSDLTPDAAAFVEAAAKINPWSTLVHILSTRAYRSLRANLSPSALAVSAAVPAGLVAAVLTRRDHRVLLQREFSRIILTGGAVAAAVPLAAFVGLHVVQGPEGHNDPSCPVPERAGPGALAKAGGLAGGCLFRLRGAPLARTGETTFPERLVACGAVSVLITFVLRVDGGVRGHFVSLSGAKTRQRPISVSRRRGPTRPRTSVGCVLCWLTDRSRTPQASGCRLPAA